MHTGNLSYGPRLVADPTAPLRAALLVSPPTSIEAARPLAGEPNAVHYRAVSEQNVLIKTLMQYDCEVTLLSSWSQDPYSSIVVDAAIIFENGAVMLRPSAMTRRGESAWLESEFEKRDFPIAGHIASPGLLDGSDILLAGRTAFIGVSRRNNALGRAGFAQIARAHGFDAVEVQLAPEAASLRAVAGVIAPDKLIVAPERYVDRRAFADFEVLTTPVDEAQGAGVLNLGENHVLADVRFPRANEVMRHAGVTVAAIDLYDYSRIGMTPSMLVLDLKRS